MISPMTICYALKMTHDFLRSKYLLEKTEYNRKCLEELSDAVDEIDNLNFEIEGFERSQWVKFDPDDLKTFPTKKDGRMFMVHQIYNGESIFNIATSNTYWWGKCNVTHWRPLPPPPGKEGK